MQISNLPDKRIINLTKEQMEIVSAGGDKLSDEELKFLKATHEIFQSSLELVEHMIFMRLNFNDLPNYIKEFAYGFSLAEQ